MQSGWGKFEQEKRNAAERTSIELHPQLSCRRGRILLSSLLCVTQGVPDTKDTWGVIWPPPDPTRDIPSISGPSVPALETNVRWPRYGTNKTTCRSVFSYRAGEMSANTLLATVADIWNPSAHAAKAPATSDPLNRCRLAHGCSSYLNKNTGLFSVSPSANREAILRMTFASLCIFIWFVAIWTFYFSQL